MSSVTDLGEAERYVRTAVASDLHRTPPEFLARVMAEYDRRGRESALDAKLKAALIADLATNQARVAAVRALHCLDEEMSAATGRDCCKGCATSVTHSRWPCKTIAALDGQEAHHA